MRGLENFINDIRVANSAEVQEQRIQFELRNVKAKFGLKNLSGYQRKKYVAKLAYIYITTNAKKLDELVFGLEQCLILLRSRVYSEKFFGYMTLELFMCTGDVEDKVVYSVIGQLKVDLCSDDENCVGLALNYIGTTGAMYRTLCNEMFYLVFKILSSHTSSPMLKSKASVTLLAMLRNTADLLSGQEDSRLQDWTQTIFSLLDDDREHGLVMSGLPLIEYMAQHVAYDECVKLVPRLIQLLCEYLDAAESAYQTSNNSQYSTTRESFLINNLARLLNVLIGNAATDVNFNISNIDKKSLATLRHYVRKAIKFNKPEDTPLPLWDSNSLGLIELACKLEPSSEAIAACISTLSSLLSSRSGNARYLSLVMLAKMATIVGPKAEDLLRDNLLTKLFSLLKTEPDISASRKAVELLSILANEEYAQVTVTELLKFVRSRAKTLKSFEVDVYKHISKILERFPSNLEWYVLSTMKLLYLVGNEVTLGDGNAWQKVCQIVVNNPDIQRVSCLRLVDYVSSRDATESIIRIGAFLLGEFGDLVVHKISIGDLFNVFMHQYANVSVYTRAMILTTMIKLFRFNPKISTSVLKFLQLELNSVDISLQSRAYQYIKIIQLSKLKDGDMKLTDLLFSAMPPFPEIINSQDVSNCSSPPSSAGYERSVFETNALRSTTSGSSIPISPPQSRSVRIDYSSIELSERWEEGFKRMILHQQGIFYQDLSLQILFRVIQDPEEPSLSTVTLTFVNKGVFPLTGFNIGLVPIRTDNTAEYVVDVLESANFTVHSKDRTAFVFKIQTQRPFSIEKAPIVQLKYRHSGKINKLNLKIGYGVTSTLKVPPTPTTFPEFVQRWKSIHESIGTMGEFQETLEAIDMPRLETNLRRIGFELIKQESILNTLFAVSIVHTKSEGKFGSLLKFHAVDNKIHTLCKTTSPGELSKDIVGCILSAI
ncbi:HBL171Cp [Eremothecium sinecaudum]|uniref:AP-2 complex subunit alpha n=1 Tax=Eremothecium sinecaudum TaxID=45286 RepID=A0A109UW91_9SACH|nr:HBL171Cp [Eremothecium sinecaudum]AMD18731.1 HBL171Cp [Eremothecium sinecaudum]